MDSVCDGVMKVCYCAEEESHFVFTHVNEDRIPNSSRVSGDPHIAWHVMQLLESVDCDARAVVQEVEAEIANQKKLHRRAGKVRGDYSHSTWRKYLNVPATSPLHDPTSVQAKEFKARFRIPWQFLQHFLLPWTAANFPTKKDAVGRDPIPIEFKLLGVLRYLGRAVHFDDVAEYADIGFKGEAIRVFFHDFIRLFAMTFYPEWIKPQIRRKT